jgi:PHD-zinc-finger like domain
VEPPKISHKKKTEKEREKDRIERENAQKAADYYRKKQEDMNRPVNPREPLKRTANNMWVHVTCAVWTPEVKFGNAKALEPSEGIPSIPSARHDEICRACKGRGGACVACHSCRAPGKYTSDIIRDNLTPFIQYTLNVLTKMGTFWVLTLRQLRGLVGTKLILSASTVKPAP